MKCGFQLFRAVRIAPLKVSYKIITATSAGQRWAEKKKPSNECEHDRTCYQGDPQFISKATNWAVREGFEISLQ